jgi:translation initiation factor 3 subunit I
MWEVETGRCVFTWETRTAVRVVAYALGDEMAMFITDATMGQPCTIHIVPIEADPEDRELLFLIFSKAVGNVGLGVVLTNATFLYNLLR